MDQDLRVNHKRPLRIDSELIQTDGMHCRNKSLTEAIRLKQLLSRLSSTHGKCQSGLITGCGSAMEYPFGHCFINGFLNSGISCFQGFRISFLQQCTKFFDRRSCARTKRPVTQGSFFGLTDTFFCRFMMCHGFLIFG